MFKPLPKRFLETIKDLPGYNEESFLEVHENGQQVTSVRLNPAKVTAAIGDLPIESVVPWCAAGRYLSTRPSFTADPVFHGGAYYVQEASSMFLDHLLNELYKGMPQPNRVLDLCAAPGGKSTLLAASLPESFIVSNEVIKTRVSVLSENISKWGSDNVVVTSNDPKDFKRLTGFFNLVVVDAPCSGSGLFRKDPEAIDEWSEANVEMCSLRQQRILTDAVEALQQNGYLIYSTCSYSSREDEDICDWIIEQLNLQPVKIGVDPSWHVVETFSKKHAAPAYRFYPDKVKGEGFFAACFQQTNPVDDCPVSQSKFAIASKQVQSIAEPFLASPAKYVLRDQKEIVIASLKKWEEEVSIVSTTLNVRKSGVALGTVKGKDFIPHQELALSHLLTAEIPLINLGKEDALQYLRRQNLSVDFERKGWAVCSYKQVQLGWVKVLPNRVNNYYPTNWRILKL